MSSLAETIEKLEQAPGPSYALECEIGAVIGSTRKPPRAYTASIDAAMTLMPDGWHLVELRHLSPTVWFARVADMANDYHEDEAKAPNGPIALGLACLKARSRLTSAQSADAAE